jgi:hypothetical protein
VIHACDALGVLEDRKACSWTDNSKWLLVWCLCGLYWHVCKILTWITMILMWEAHQSPVTAIAISSYGRMEAFCNYVIFGLLICRVTQAACSALGCIEVLGYEAHLRMMLQPFWWFMFYSNFLIGVVVQKWSNKCAHCSYPIAYSSVFCSCTHSACANGVCGPKGNCMGWLQWHRHNWASFAWDKKVEKYVKVGQSTKET